MRENVNRDGLRPLGSERKRLDLNDLLKRAESQRKNDRKFNLLIYCGAFSVVVVFFLLLSL